MKAVSHLYARFERDGGDLSLSWPRRPTRDGTVALEADDVFRAFKAGEPLVAQEGEDPVQVYLLRTASVAFIKLIEDDVDEEAPR